MYTFTQGQLQTYILLSESAWTTRQLEVLRKKGANESGWRDELSTINTARSVLTSLGFFARLPAFFNEQNKPKIINRVNWLNDVLNIQLNLTQLPSTNVNTMNYILPN
jgi:hypothetical protein